MNETKSTKSSSETVSDTILQNITDGKTIRINHVIIQFHSLIKYEKYQPTSIKID